MASMPLENIAEVILTPTGDVLDSVGTRSIPITRKEPLITVGRSSRNKSKNLQPNHDNAYFDSPVMSRLHSWIKCDEGGKVLISDAGSMHGTYLDDKLLEPKLFVPLETGSQVRFGNSVTRGPDVYPPKAFDVKVVQNSRMAEIQHGYGITSDELILPDSPYFSSDEEEDDEDEVMITRVNPINTVDLTSASDHGSDWELETAQKRVPGHWNESEWSERPKAKGWPGSSWSDEPPSEQPITIIRESLRENVCIDLDPPSIIRDTNIVDLTAETPVLQQNKLPGARISIPDLLAQERQEQSRRSSQTPVRDRALSGDAMSSVGGRSDTQSVENYDEDSMDEDSNSDPEAGPESVPTSPFSPESIKASANPLPSLPSMQPSMPTLVNEIVPPEVQKAWNSTWTAAPYLSPYVYVGGTSSASDTMEQIRKAEAMRDRAQEFLRSRIEMQSSRSFQTPKEPENDYPTPNMSTSEDAAKPNPAIPLWVRNFGQGTKPNAVEEADARPIGGILPPNQRTDVPECVSNRSETRSPSPVLKMAGNFQMSDDEEEEEEEREETEQRKNGRETYSDSDSSLSEASEDGYRWPESSVSDRSESEDISDSEDEDLHMMGEFIPAEEGDDDDDEVEGEEEDEDVDEAVVDFASDDEGHDTESDSSDDEMTEEPPKGTETAIIQNSVKSAMSMENFFSPKDEEEARSSHEDEIVRRWNAEIDDLFSAQPDLEIKETNDAADVDMDELDADLIGPPLKKRKRSESEEIEACPQYEVASELEALEISTPRKIAPLPQRFLARSGQNTSFTEFQNPHEEAERKELLVLASELKNELEAVEPEAKRPRVQNAGATWGSTIATAMAGALIGGVGVFAALVATAGDM
ncbi:hypothetical protein TWF718_000160 [Orbilia javanica]|uniref:FHA domain-containing protein n=1 Tax=Orbilia javanica TaxID=47235 RepID=A0AAN8MWR6_9PEZI